MKKQDLAAAEFASSYDSVFQRDRRKQRTCPVQWNTTRWQACANCLCRREALLLRRDQHDEKASWRDDTKIRTCLMRCSFLTRSLCRLCQTCLESSLDEEARQDWVLLETFYENRYFFLRHRRKSFRPLSKWMQMPARYWYQVQNFMIKLHDKVSNFLFSFSRSSDQARLYMSRGGGDHMKVGSRDPTQAEFGTWLNSRRGSGEAHPLLSFFFAGLSDLLPSWIDRWKELESLLLVSKRFEDTLWDCLMLNHLNLASNPCSVRIP